MAVTSESQIYDTSSAETIATYLTETLSEVNKAKDYLTQGAQYCGPDYFAIDGKSEPQEQINALLNGNVEQLITNIPKIKSGVLAAAKALKEADQKAYNEYVAEQKAKAEAEAKAKAEAEAKAREEKQRRDEERNHGMEAPTASPLPYTGSSSNPVPRYL